MISSPGCNVAVELLIRSTSVCQSQGNVRQILQGKMMATAM